MRLLHLLWPHLPLRLAKRRVEIPSPDGTSGSWPPGPIVLGGQPWTDGIVLDADPLARALGVRRGLPLGSAHRLAPEATFLDPDPDADRDAVEAACERLAGFSPGISGTSDVAQKFPERRSTKTVDGKEIQGYFAEDFTLAEIKTLRARERLPFRNQGWNGVYEIPTFQEVIDLAQRKSQEKGRVIGIYPETKHPSYFRSIGLMLEPPLVKTLVANGYADTDAPVFIQSFEVQNLKDLSKLTRIRLVN